MQGFFLPAHIRAGLLQLLGALPHSQVEAPINALRGLQAAVSPDYDQETPQSHNDQTRSSATTGAGGS